MGNLHTRVWSFHSGGGTEHVVVLRHHVLKGERELTLDQRTVDHYKPLVADVLNSTKRYEIDIEGNKNACVVEISKTFWGGYTYACTYLGEFVECKDAEGGEGALSSCWR